MSSENTQVEQQGGVNVERSKVQTKAHSKRVILYFILLVGIIIALITIQTPFSSGNRSRDAQPRNYHAPQAAGFMELATSMRRDRKPVQIVPEEKAPLKLSVQEPIPLKPYAPPVSRYYTNKDDAQAASTLRTLKLQALSAKPFVDDFDGSKMATREERGTGHNVQAQGNAPQVMGTASLSALMQQGGSKDPNGQSWKESFLRGAGGSLTPQGYSGSVPISQQFPYELKAGTIIPGLLISGINSDLPGNIVAQVSENVWDTATGRFVLIPKGTKILGVYDSRVSFGQRRILLVWNRLVFPNGTALDIAGSPGLDMAGYSGLSGKVNEHWGKMFGAALLSSMFVAGAETVYGKDDSQGGDKKSPRDVAAESLAGSILDMGTKIMNKASDTQPTITIWPGKRMGIFVQQDVAFPYPYF